MNFTEIINHGGGYTPAQWRAFEAMKPLAGLTYVITGKLEDRLSRFDATVWLRRNGAQVDHVVKDRTTALITNKPVRVTTKVADARRHGVPVIFEQDFVRTLDYRFATAAARDARDFTDAITPLSDLRG